MVGLLFNFVSLLLLLLKAFQGYSQWEDGGGPEKD